MNTEQKKIRILLIDNDEMMRIYFRDIFWIHGRSDTYDVIMACSLKEAEKKIMDKCTKPDTIFLDMMMSIKGENNNPSERVKRTLDFIEKIKNNKDLSSIKIIIFSGQNEKSLEDIFHKAGVDGYLVKGELMPKEIISFTDKIHELNH